VYAFLQPETAEKLMEEGGLSHEGNTEKNDDCSGNAVSGGRFSVVQSGCR
jgi:hypothetical protein